MRVPLTFDVDDCDMIASIIGEESGQLIPNRRLYSGQFHQRSFQVTKPSALAAPQNQTADRPAHDQIKHQSQQAHDQDSHPDQFIVGYGASNILDKAYTGGASEHLGSHQCSPANPDGNPYTGQNFR